MRVPFRTEAAACAVLGALVLLSVRGEAHKPITSKFTYNADAYPIFLKRCGHCHIAGGVAPMSLVTYEDAFPWAESLRAELLDAGAGAPGVPADFVKAAHRDLSARELDIVLDWAVGGTPEGDPAKRPAPATLKNDWAGGKPDLVLQPTSAFKVPADTMEATHEFSLPTNLDRSREISAVDLLPGAPALLRDSTIAVRAPNAAPKKLGTWVPRQVPAAVALKPGTTLPAGADIIVTIHYKKTWKYEGQAISDSSSIGIYFAGK
jgi:hypothetical protein